MKKIKLNIDEKGKIPYLTTVLKEIPTNTILCKTLTGLGATYGEIKAKRHSIIIEPNISTIQSKSNDPKHAKDNLFGVIEGVGVDDIKEYITSSNGKYYKFLVTPESFYKVKKAFEELDIYMYSECFIMFDECHKLIQDADYREDIYLPLEDFFKFKNKALISATPIELSDPRFREFQKLVIEPQFNYQKDIYIQYTNNTLERFKQTISESKNNCICVFFNSTDAIHAIMSKTGILEESTVFCAPKSVNKLKDKTLNFKHAYSEFNPDKMKKYNFFTSRFNAGMDIELDYQPDLIMLSDVNLVEHTVLDPYTDIIQIIGRFRNGVNYITHITNSFKDYPFRSQNEVLREVDIYETCYNFIKRELGNATDNGSQYAFRKLLETCPFNRFLDANKKKAYCAVDNYVNDVMVRNIYLNRTRLFEAYNDESLMKHLMSYKMHYQYKAGDAEWLQLRNANKSIVSKRKIIVDILEKILPYETASDYEFREEIYKVDPLIVEAIDTLGIAKVRKLRYTTNSLKLAIYEAKCISPQVTELIRSYFKVKERYLLPYIKETIKRIYKECGIQPLEQVTAQTLKKYFNCTRSSIKKQEAILIVSELF